MVSHGSSERAGRSTCIGNREVLERSAAICFNEEAWAMLESYKRTTTIASQSASGRGKAMRHFIIATLRVRPRKRATARVTNGKSMRGHRPKTIDSCARRTRAHGPMTRAPAECRNGNWIRIRSNKQLHLRCGSAPGKREESMLFQLEEQFDWSNRNLMCVCARACTTI